MKIYVQRISENGMELESEEPQSIMDMESSEEQFLDSIRVRVKAFKVSGNLLVNGRISTNVTLTCSKCSETFSYPIDNEMFMYNCEILGRDIIDLTEPIREDIIVGLPIKPLCREGCCGLCSHCGKNLNEGDCSCSKIRHEFQGPRLGDFLG